MTSNMDTQNFARYSRSNIPQWYAQASERDRVALLESLTRLMLSSVPGKGVPASILEKAGDIERECLTRYLLAGSLKDFMAWLESES